MAPVVPRGGSWCACHGYTVHEYRYVTCLRTCNITCSRMKRFVNLDMVYMNHGIIYSGTSDSGHSEKRTTSERRTSWNPLHFT